MANRVSFQETWRTKGVDGYSGRPEACVWRHFLLCGGRITVQERLTGYGYDVWDIETGYTSPCGQFWLASGDWDIRDHLREFETEEQMIAWVIARANNCTGGHVRGWRTGTSAAAIGIGATP